MPGSDRDGGDTDRGGEAVDPATVASLDVDLPLADESDPDDCQRCPCTSDLEALLADERGDVERRDVAKLLATIGGLTAVGSLAAPLAGLAQVFERSYEGPIYSDDVALVDDEGEPVTENFLEFGDYATVFPETNPGIEDAPTLLVRFEEGEYGGETNPDWVASGYAAYSKVCTHAGCMVSDFEGSTLVCPCHAGKFDPLSGASVVGGPPPRPLPQLPLRLADDGTLVAGGDFEGPIGTGGE
ncbi:Rieske (2Fe-2S) protein [Halomicrobium salinisoli]|uniref:Rieske (2Fe-2S) protein n=1 Tax=Halomicrobium salinisoli TaxID=2878391 RepID=UPI001CF01096|nr:Rieske 2Fe-2S domain-containing protein [Halomicrobium salinisoli]